MTATTLDLATYTAQRYMIAFERAEQAVEKFICLVESLDERTIDRDAIEMDDERFLRDLVGAAATTGDLYV